MPIRLGTIRLGTMRPENPVIYGVTSNSIASDAFGGE
jgi:hypothetical protein